MKMFLGVEYHKAFSYGTIMTETGEIVKQGPRHSFPVFFQKRLRDYFMIFHSVVVLVAVRV